MNHDLVLTASNGDVIPFGSIARITTNMEGDTVAELNTGSVVPLCKGDLRQQISLLVRMGASYVDFHCDNYEDSDGIGFISTLLPED